MLNRNLAESSAARSISRQLEGRVLAIHVVGLPLHIYFRSLGQSVVLALTHEGTADASISASPIAFANLVGSQPQSAFRSGNVRIEGDAEVAQAFRELLALVAPDLEEELSRIVGDVAAHQIGNLTRGALAFGRHTAGVFAQNVAEYLQEESRDVPARVEVDEFVAAVDTLRDDVERAAARVTRLVQRRQRPPG
jgi:ubiquinone biosynthesis protein UbiJ